VSGEALLRVEGLVKHFPVHEGLMRREVASVKAVDGVSFEIPSGHTLGLVGESGCGKSTVGRTLLQLERPTAGRIHFEGRDITSLPERELRELRRNLQIIFQDPFSSLNPRMTVMDIVGEALTVHGLARGREVEERVVDLLQKVGIPRAWLNRYPHEFSGGQRQRVSIARAIALEPRLIVCDEAVSALDVSIQAQVINLLIRLREEMNLSYLFIAHDLSVVRHISDEVAVMYLGQLVETAPVRRLFETPAHPYTRALLSAIPVPDPTRRSQRIVLEGDVPTPLDPPAGCRFHTRCPAVMERCRSEEPRTVHVGGEQRVKCFLAYESQPGEGWYGALLERSEAAEAQNRSVSSVSPPGAAVSPAPSPAPERADPARAALAASGQPVSPETALTRIEDDGALARRAGGIAVAIGGGLLLLGATAWGLVLAVGAFFFLLWGRVANRVAWSSALAIALLLCWLGGGALAAWSERMTARAQLEALRSEVEHFSATTGRYPGSLDELGWRLVPIVGVGEPRDPWGRRWLYRAPGVEGRDFDLGSPGPDGRSGGGDDLGSFFEVP